MAMAMTFIEYVRMCMFLRFLRERRDESRKLQELRDFAAALLAQRPVTNLAS